MSLVITGYEVGEQIGDGGMAQVYRARHLRLEREVAIKVMRPQLKFDASFSERFLREAKIAANLSHPNIIHIYDVDNVNEHLFLAMELVLGGDLSATMAAARSKEQVLSIFSQLCDALDYAHDEGYIHRDIKPANILFRKNGTLVLSDFGIARAQDSNTHMTRAGSIIGTPAYMSPEQAQGHEVSSRSDLYSLAVIIYQYLTGQLPFGSNSSISTAIKHINDPIPTMPEHLRALQGFFDTALAKQAEDRFANGKELMAALEKDLKPVKSLAADLESTVVLKKPPQPKKASSEPASESRFSPRVFIDLLRQYFEKVLPSPFASFQAKAILPKLTSKTGLLQLAMLLLAVGLVSAVIYSERKLVPKNQAAENDALNLNAKKIDQDTNRVVIKSDTAAVNVAEAFTIAEPKLICSAFAARDALAENLSFVSLIFTNDTKQQAVTKLQSLVDDNLIVAERQLERKSFKNADGALHLAREAALTLQDVERLAQVEQMEKRLNTSAQKIKDKMSVSYLLTRGDRSLYKRKLYGSGTDNAWYYYSQVLKSFPQDENAIEGQEKVKRKVFEQFDVAITQGDSEQAQLHADFLNQIDANSVKTPYMSAALDFLKQPKSAKNRRINSLYNQGLRELKFGSLKSASRTYTRIEKMSPHHPRLKKLGDSIANYFATQVQKRLDAKQWQQAEKFIADGLAYSPNHQKLLRQRSDLPPEPAVEEAKSE